MISGAPNGLLPFGFSLQAKKNRDAISNVNLIFFIFLIIEY